MTRKLNRIVRCAVDSLNARRRANGVEKQWWQVQDMMEMVGEEMKLINSHPGISSRDFSYKGFMRMMSERLPYRKIGKRGEVQI